MREKNKIWHIRRASATEYALKSLGDLTAVVLVIAALTAAIFEKSNISAAVCVILTAGVIFRVVTYVKARRILETMADEAMPSATVIRGGNARVVRADDIVVGDVIMLGPGDIVPCDGRIVYGDEIRVSEKGITENKTTVIKGDTVIITDANGSGIPCEYRVNMLFAGSAILSGRCRIVATACGDDTLVSMRQGGLLIASGEEIPIIDRLSEWCRIGSVGMLLCVLLLSALSVVLHVSRGAAFSLYEAFIDAMALAAASVSSYLVTVGYIALTVPIRRVALHKDGSAVVKDVSEIARIADAARIVVSDVSAFKSGKASYTSYYVDGALREVKKEDGVAAGVLSDVLKTIVKGDGKTSLADDAPELSEYEKLLDKIAETSAAEYDFDLSAYAKKGEFPVDYKKVKGSGGMVFNVLMNRGGVFELHLSGGVYDVLSYCDKVKKGKTELPMTPEIKGAILDAVKEIEARGGTVIAKAHRNSMYSTLKRLSVLQSSMCFDCFIAVEEGLDAEVEALSENFRSSGMNVILLSSQPLVDRGYLAKAGVVSQSVAVITCRDVLLGKEFPEGDVIIAVPPVVNSGGKIDDAAKVRMATVRRITEKLDNTVVLTADPTESGMMSDKCIGVAIGTSPSRPIPQTLKRRADISVYPKNQAGYGGFAEAVRAISATVCSLENLRKVALYTVTSQFARLMCMLLSIITDIQLMNAASILLLGMIFDLAAVLVISFSVERCEVSDGDARKKSIPGVKDVLKRAGLGAAGGAFAFLSAVLPSYYTSVNLSSYGNGLVSAASISLLLIQLVFLSEFILDGGALYKSGHASLAYVMYAAMTLLTVMLLMFTDICTVIIGDVNPGWIVSTVSAAGAPVLLGAWEILKLFVGGRRKR